ELVTLRLEDPIDPNELTGEYLNPKEFYEAMQDENTVILDTRNDYEYDVGHFRGEIRPEIETFRELPQWVQEYRHLNERQHVIKEMITNMTLDISVARYGHTFKPSANSLNGCKKIAI